MNIKKELKQIEKEEQLKSKERIKTVKKLRKSRDKLIKSIEGKGR